MKVRVTVMMEHEAVVDVGELKLGHVHAIVKQQESDSGLDGWSLGDMSGHDEWRTTDIRTEEVK